MTAINLLSECLKCWRKVSGFPTVSDSLRGAGRWEKRKRLSASFSFLFLNWLWRSRLTPAALRQMSHWNIWYKCGATADAGGLLTLDLYQTENQTARCIILTAFTWDTGCLPGRRENPSGLMSLAGQGCKASVFWSNPFRLFISRKFTLIKLQSLLLLLPGTLAARCCEFQGFTRAAPGEFQNGQMQVSLHHCWW